MTRFPIPSNFHPSPTTRSDQFHASEPFKQLSEGGCDQIPDVPASKGGLMTSTTFKDSNFFSSYKAQKSWTIVPTIMSLGPPGVPKKSFQNFLLDLNPVTPAHAYMHRRKSLYEIGTPPGPHCSSQESSSRTPTLFNPQMISLLFWTQGDAASLTPHF